MFFFCCFASQAAPNADDVSLRSCALAISLVDNSAVSTNEEIRSEIFFFAVFSVPSSLCYVSGSPSKSQTDYSRWPSSVRSALYLLLLSLLFYCRLIGPRSAGCTSLQLLRNLAPHHQTVFFFFCCWVFFFFWPAFQFPPHNFG